MFVMPEKRSEVTVVDCYGVRRAIQVNAKSTDWAASHYFGAVALTPPKTSRKQTTAPYTRSEWWERKRCTISLTRR